MSLYNAHEDVLHTIQGVWRGGGHYSFEQLKLTLKKNKKLLLNPKQSVCLLCSLRFRPPLPLWVSRVS